MKGEDRKRSLRRKSNAMAMRYPGTKPVHRPTDRPGRNDRQKYLKAQEIRQTIYPAGYTTDETTPNH
jgi:hypothetical protein